MTKDDRLSLAIVFIAIFLCMGMGWVLTSQRISKLEDQMIEIQCRHVFFEDGSTMHKYAELAKLCMRNRD